MTMNNELRKGQRIRFADGREARVIANHAARSKPDAYMMRLTILPDDTSEAVDVYVVKDGDADVTG